MCIAVSEAPSTSTAATNGGGGVSVAAKNKARSRNRHKRYTHSEKWVYRVPGVGVPKPTLILAKSLTSDPYNRGPLKRRKSVV